MPRPAVRLRARAAPRLALRAALAALASLGPGLVAGCERAAPAPRAAADAPAELPDGPSPTYVAARAAYVGDSACVACHAGAARAYAERSMAHSFHRWTPDVRVEPTLPTPITHPRTGLRYAVVEEAGRLWQVERVDGPDGRRLHELRRRVDWVVGSGRLARTYFTEENGRLFQLPLTWYRAHGWDFSPGYAQSNPRFSRELPDRCVACHGSYPRTLPHLEGKYAELRPGIGCERCHGPGALHVRERTPATIVNPARLPLARRLEVCEQCHVHTETNVLREGRRPFDYVPSEPLHDYWAFFKAGGIDVVSHSDRLRQSACFRATARTPRPLECATCHDPHRADAGDARARNAPCLSCHEPAALRARLGASARAAHVPAADCVRCHMPPVREGTVPHASFTEHWIGVAGRDRVRDAAGTAPPPGAAAELEPYFARDRAGPEAAVYQAMGAATRAAKAGDRPALVDAAARLRAALARDTARPDAHFLLGVASHELGDGAVAIPALERALRLRPERPEALRALAQAYARAGRPAAAIDSLYGRALALQPRLAWMRAEHADLLQARGERARAVAAYRAAVAEQPSLATAWFNLGATLAGGGDAAGAAAALGRAVDLDPALDRALGAMVRVRVRAGLVLDARPIAPPTATRGIAALAPLPVRAAAGRAGDAPGVLLAPVPAGATAQILRRDGAVVRTLRGDGGPTLAWDLRDAAGAPVGSGLYRARVLAGGTPGAVTVPFGVVREDVP